MRLPLLLAAGAATFALFSAPAHADARANVNHTGQNFPSAEKGASARVTFEEKAAEGELAVTGRKKKWTLKLSRLVLRNFDFFPDEDGELLVAFLKGSYYGRYKLYGSDPDALLFIRNGAIVKKYTYSELLKDPDKAQESVSHTHWLSENIKIDFAAGTVTFATKDGHRYRFTLPDGTLAATETFSPER